MCKSKLKYEVDKSDRKVRVHSCYLWEKNELYFYNMKNIQFRSLYSVFLPL